MDTMTFTKAAGALCGALLVFLLGKWAAEELYHVGGHGEQAYVIETGGDDEAPAEDEAAGPDIIEVMASADPEAGAAVFRKCQSCHKLEEGANGTGPYLHGVVGREIASADGFGYSDALSGMEGEWTVEELSAFLQNPKDYAPGTVMSFAGLRDIQDRADVIAYLDGTDGEMTDYAALAEETASAGEDADVAEAAEEDADAAEAAEEDSVDGEADAAGEEEAAAESDAENAAAEETAEGEANAAAEEEEAAEAEVDAATAEETAEGETDAGAAEEAAASAGDSAILANADARGRREGVPQVPGLPQGGRCERRRATPGRRRGARDCLGGRL